MPIPLHTFELMKELIIYDKYVHHMIKAGELPTAANYYSEGKSLARALEEAHDRIDPKKIAPVLHSALKLLKMPKSSRLVVDSCGQARFGSGNFSWERFLDFVAFIGEIAVMCNCNGLEETAENVYFNLKCYVNSELSHLIDKNGGWSNFREYCFRKHIHRKDARIQKEAEKLKREIEKKKLAAKRLRH